MIADQPHREVLTRNQLMLDDENSRNTGINHSLRRDANFSDSD